MRALADRVSDLSRALHDLIWDDASQSLCARAWDRREASSFWAVWVRVFGAAHCEASWRWHRLNRE